MTHHKPSLLLLLLVLAVIGASGCVHVSPYEREYLARPSMDTAREGPEQKLNAHVFDAREGAMGGYGSTGGGCGCN